MWAIEILCVEAEGNRISIRGRCLLHGECEECEPEPHVKRKQLIFSVPFFSDGDTYYYVVLLQ